MKNTRFNEMLSVVGKENYKRFTDLVWSPYFNNNERVTGLWRWIVQNPKDDNDYTKDELLKAMEPDEKLGSKFTDSNFRMVLSDFVRLSEVFMLLEEGDIIRLGRDRLLGLLKEKNLNKGYTKHLRQLKEETAGTGNKDVSYYSSMYVIECEEFEMCAQSGKIHRVEKINKLTDLTWITMKLDNFIKAFMLGADAAEMTFYKDIMDTVEMDKKIFRKEHPVIYSRWLILKMLHEPFTGNVYFTELEKYTAKLKYRSQLDYNYDALLTYCRTHEEYKKEYSIIKLLDKKGLIANEDGQVDPARLELIINSALANNRLAEAERWKERCRKD